MFESREQTTSEAVPNTRNIAVVKSKDKRSPDNCAPVSVSIVDLHVGAWITGTRATGLQGIRARGRRKFRTTFNLATCTPTGRSSLHARRYTYVHGDQRRTYYFKGYGVFGKRARRRNIWNDDHASHTPAASWSQ